MREIEIKCRVQDVAKLLEKLEGRGIVLGETLSQHDVVYGPKGARPDSTGTNWLRIRTETIQPTGASTTSTSQTKPKIFFTLKQTQSTNGDSLEYELEINDATEMEAIILHLGYELYSDLTKIRRTAHLDETEICFDEVAPLGMFIEVERLEAPDADPQKVRAELRAFLSDLGLRQTDEVHQGYDIMMNEHLAANAAAS